MITIEVWSKEAWPDGTLALKASTFVRHNNKRVDPWFARYVQGKEPARYQMPAIPLKVVWGTHGQGYIGIVYIDELTDPNDPILVWGWDTWNQRNI